MFGRLRDAFTLMPPRWLPPLAQAVFTLLAASSAIAVALLLTGWLRPPAAWIVGDLTSLINAVVATGVFAVAAATSRGAERQWRALMAIGLGGWAVGQGAWSWARGIDGVAMTFPHPVNMLFWALPVGVFAALVVIARADHAASRSYDTGTTARVVVLDGLIIFVSLLQLTWYVVADNLRYNTSWETTLLTISYAAGDLVLIVLTILMAVALNSMWRPRLAWLIAGLSAIGFSDVLYADTIASQEVGDEITAIGYAVGPLLLLPAALAPPRAGTRHRKAPLVVLALPYVPLAAVCTLVVLDAVTGRMHPVEVYLLVAAVVLVVIRHMVTLGQLYRVHRWLSHRALHDPLTGAANRTLLGELLDASASEEPAQGPGLIYLDLNGFKNINDTLGHRAGDALLRAITDRLRECVRGNDTVARVGGDEFVLLLDPAPARPAQLLDQISAAVRVPVEMPGTADPVVVTASLGYHPIAPGQTVGEALADADQAMYDNKRTEQ